MSNMTYPAAPLLALLGLCNGCFYVDMDIEELRTRIDQATLTVPDSETARIGSELTAANSFEFDLRDELDRGLLEWVDYAGLTTLRLLPNSGAKDLGFVREVKIRMAAADSGLPEVTAARYRGSHRSAAPDGGLDMAVEPAIDYLEYVNHPLRFEIEMKFAYPGKAWSFEVDLGLELALAYKGKLL